MAQLTVRSHVGRDLLQSAQVFRSDRKVVWEYVANSLQYSEPGRPPRVLVQIDERKKIIRVTDNGRGMDRIDLEHFFTMHAENRERASGRVGRGLFGTGKSAAFGIGDCLQVTSVKSGNRTRVRLTRESITNMVDGSPIPVEILVSDSVEVPVGTEVEISRINLSKIDRAGIIAFIERHLAQYPRDVEVFVDHHECAFKEPEAEEAYFFETKEGDRTLLGEVRLTVKVARGPLDPDLRGIQVFSYGNWHATTLAGSENKKMAEYLFGEIEVPLLEDYKGPIAPFDNTRSGELNPNNPVVTALYRFIGPSIDQVRRSLVERERQRAKSEEVKKLSREADRIAELISEDFASVQARIKRAKAISTGRQRFAESGVSEEVWTEGGDKTAAGITLSEPADPESRPPKTSEDSRPYVKPVEPIDNGDTKGKPVGGSGPKRGTRGGFSVEYKNVGVEEHRGRYLADRRAIVINLDHPQIVSAYSERGVESMDFIRLSWEVAISEYALALSLEVAEPHTNPDEAIFDVRETMDRLSRKLAGLYRKEVRPE